MRRSDSDGAAVPGERPVRRERPPDPAEARDERVAVGGVSALTAHSISLYRVERRRRRPRPPSTSTRQAARWRARAILAMSARHHMPALGSSSRCHARTEVASGPHERPARRIRVEIECAVSALTPANCHAFIGGLPQDLAVVRVEPVVRRVRRPIAIGAPHDRTQGRRSDRARAAPRC